MGGFSAALEKLGSHLPDAEVLKFFKRFDKNGFGSINSDDLAAQLFNQEVRLLLCVSNPPPPHKYYPAACG